MLEEIRADEIVKRTMEIKKSIDVSMDLEKIVDEAKVLHANRTSRKLYKIAMDADSMGIAVLMDMSVRARMSEMLAAVYVQKFALETAFEKCVSHITVVHADLIKELATNATDRKHVINKVLAPIVSKIAALTSAMEVLDIFMKDLDKAGYSMTTAKDNLRMIHERKSV